MNLRYQTLLLMLCVTLGIFAQGRGRHHRPALRQTKKEFVSSFQTGTLVNTDMYHLPYRYALLNPNQEGDAIIVLYLHGASGRGNDNIAQLGASVVEKLYAYLKESGKKSLLIIPQCPNDAKWNMNGNNGKSMSKAIMQVVNDVSGKFNLSDSRKYVLGYSLGGGGVLRILSDCPGTFFAGLAASAPLDGKILPESIAETRIIMTVGDTDYTTVKDLKDLVNKIKKSGGDATVISFKGKDHQKSGPEAFNPTILNSLFK